MKLSSVTPRSKLKYAMLIHIVLAIVLVPVTAQTFDLLGLTGGSEAWVRWGFSPFYSSKFGFIVTILGVGAQGIRLCFEKLGFSGVAAQNIGWKLPLVTANLLSAGLIFRIGIKFGHSRPHIPAMIWLLSPVSIWVAAGHGQLEPLTIVSILGAIFLMLDGRLIWSGIITGIGVGIEYVPILVVLALFIVFITGNLDFRRLVSFGVAFTLTLVGNFLPFFTWARNSSGLVGGLHSSYAVTASKVSDLAAAASPSIWSFVPGEGSWWILLYAVLVICMMVMGVVVARRNRSRVVEAGVAVACVCLIGLPLMDPGSLPQFADLSLAGFCVLAATFSVPSALIIFAPVFGLASGLLHVYGGNFDSYWYDMWRTTGSPGWLPPESLRAAVISSRVSVILTTVSLVYFLRSFYCGVRENSGTHRGLKLALGSSGLMAGVLAFWALQPSYWVGVINSHPSELPGYHHMIQQISGDVSKVKGAEYAVFPIDLVQAANSAVVKPDLRLIFEVKPLVTPSGVGHSVPISNSYHLDVNIKNWYSESSSVGSIWISLLFGTQVSSKSSLGSFSAPDILIKGARLNSVETKCVTIGWCLGTYAVPANDISSQGAIKIAFPVDTEQEHLWLNANDVGPWMRVFPRSGYISLESGHTILRRNFITTVGNQGELAVDYQKGLVANLRIAVDGSPLPGLIMKGAAARWPPSSGILATWSIYVGLLLSSSVLVMSVCFGLLMTRRLIADAGDSPDRRASIQNL